MNSTVSRTTAEVSVIAEATLEDIVMEQTPGVQNFSASASVPTGVAGHSFTGTTEVTTPEIQSTEAIFRLIPETSDDASDTHEAEPVRTTSPTTTTTTSTITASSKEAVTTSDSTVHASIESSYSASPVVQIKTTNKPMEIITTPRTRFAASTTTTPTIFRLLGNIELVGPWNSSVANQPANSQSNWMAISNEQSCQLAFFLACFVGTLVAICLLTGWILTAVCMKSQYRKKIRQLQRGRLKDQIPERLPLSPRVVSMGDVEGYGDDTRPTAIDRVPNLTVKSEYNFPQTTVTTFGGPDRNHHSAHSSLQSPLLQRNAADTFKPVVVSETGRPSEQHGRSRSVVSTFAPQTMPPPDHTSPDTESNQEHLIGEVTQEL
uniref:Sushi domain-containing protein n=1 Tax=Mesocestoides corti TaxID=53468 RepID=A0A5K3EU86_MESCO